MSADPMSIAIDQPAHQFDDIMQQHEADLLGMWTFIATEVLFFGALIACYIVYRWAYPAAFEFGSRHLIMIFGAANTTILLCSSFTMALGVHFAKSGKRNLVAACLCFTIMLGLAFLVVKGFEYSTDISEGLVPGSSFALKMPVSPGRLTGVPDGLQLFFWLYFAMTGLHAFHMILGISMLSIITVMVLKNAANVRTVEVAGLYWHFVDMVWIFLFPMLYLIGHHHL